MTTLRLNHRVVIMKPATGRDANGQPLTGLMVHDTLWADVAHLNGLQTIRADAATSVVKASVRIRWPTDVTAQMQVWHGAAKYAVKALLEDETGRVYVDLVCERVGG